MRYYSVELTPPAGEGGRLWTSHPPKGLISGTADPNALNVDFDMIVMPNGLPAGLMTFTIEGVLFQDVLQASQFNPDFTTGKFWQIKISGGMAAGLPLNNSKQAGLLAQGVIWQSWGNWVGTEMSLAFVFAGSQFSYDHPGNIVLDWKTGQKLSDCLAETFNTAFPGMKQQINISESSVNTQTDKPGYFRTLDELAQGVLDLTNSFGYPGVTIIMQGGAIHAFDSSKTNPATQIEFTDLIGQPSWVRPYEMQAKLVMRSDVEVGSRLTFPKGMQSLPGMVQTSQASLPSSIKYQTAFQGDFNVTSVRHQGVFRSTDAGQWVTTVNCFPVGPSAPHMVEGYITGYVEGFEPK